MNTTNEKEMKMLFGYMQENTFSWLFKMSQVRQILRCGRHVLWNGKFPIKISCSFFWLIPTTSILVSKKWC